ncbi:circadian clock protein KaiC [Paraliomyxa miuraensis]|uniref:circadian clock protein KaiC n=1 Tax=Paraliomyxa miuraensis TaxID=376150 RepID=UPI00224FE796|nr:circadian clock protein KaiC [Paraliomyxa miuraensis]MCX4243372.1 circadian clock protein KaiC [Paraliomyxa miuraensis]
MAKWTGGGPSERGLDKVPTGIDGLDEVLDGGLPSGRPTLVCGGAGCGKTLFGMQFLVRGALLHGEPGVFIAFEERPEDLAANVASLGIELDDLQARGLLAIDHIRVEPHEIVESGEYDLQGLFLRLGLAIDTVGAKRVVIDTLEVLLGGLSNYGILRAELRRLFAWLKERGVSAIITAERGEGRLTRHGLEEYVSDCVIVLDHRVLEQISTRRLRVVKYRGSTHGTNEYPFLIDRDGITVLPITGAGLAHEVSDERVSSGVARLDAMLGGQGYYRGSTVLVSGTAGVGKSTLAAHFVDATCSQGERVLYMSFEEAPAQILRNMHTIGIELAAHQAAGLLRFAAARPTAWGLETHLVVIHRLVREHQPSAVVLDPISTFVDAGASADAHDMLVRLIDALKGSGITALLTSLTSPKLAPEATEVQVSSMVDTWLLVKSIEVDGERNRGLYVLKSRGMAHSNQVREFVIGAGGVSLLDVYVGPEGVVTGSARLAQEARERDEAHREALEREHVQRLLERRKALHREQLARLEAELTAETVELERKLMESRQRAEAARADRRRMALARKADRVPSEES